MKRQKILLGVLTLSSLCFIGTLFICGIDGVIPSFSAQKQEHARLDALTEKARQGDPKAQFDLGDAYDKQQKYAEALLWYTKAAHQNYANAQNNLGVLYMNGRGVPEDPAEGIRQFQLAAEGGVATAQNNLGNLYLGGIEIPQDSTQAVFWYQKAGDQGSLEAQKALGLKIYLRGNGSVPKDYTKALKWLLLATDKGDAETAAYAGWIYVGGLGGNRNITDGLKLLLRSAEARNEVGLSFLGEIAKQYHQPPEYGIAIAEGLLGTIYLEGKDVPSDDAEAFKWFQKSAEWDEAPSQVTLGQLYGSGKGTAVDYIQAYKWSSLAASHNNSVAKLYLPRVKAAMTPEQIAQAEQLVQTFTPRTAAPSATRPVK